MKSSDSYEFNCSYTIYHRSTITDKLEDFWFKQQVKFAEMTAGNARHFFSQEMYPNYCAIRQHCIWLYKKNFTIATIARNMFKYFISK